MLDQFLTLQTLVGTVSGASITLILTAAAQRFSWPQYTAARIPPASNDAAPASPPQSAGPARQESPAVQAVRRSELLPAEVRRFVVDQETSARRIAAVKAGHILISFMQKHGATGYFTVKEIDAWWRYCRQEWGLDYLSGTVVRSELSGIRNVWIGLRRLNAPEYRAVKARNEGVDRAVLYKIPTARSDAGLDAGLETETARDIRQATGAASGKRPANVQDEPELEGFRPSGRLAKAA